MSGLSFFQRPAPCCGMRRFYNPINAIVPNLDALNDTYYIKVIRR